jgi:hypothetical protein
MTGRISCTNGYGLAAPNLAELQMAKRNQANKKEPADREPSGKKGTIQFEVFQRRHRALVALVAGTARPTKRF